MLKLPTPTTEIRDIYTDFPMKFEVNPMGGDLLRHTNESAIKEAIRNLIMTNRGERLFQPNLGSDIRQMLFEQNTPDVLMILKDKIQDVIKIHEPRAAIDNLSVSSETDTHSVTINISFYVLNRENPVSLHITLERIR